MNTTVSSLVAQTSQSMVPSPGPEQVQQGTESSIAPTPLNGAIQGSATGSWDSFISELIADVQGFFEALQKESTEKKEESPELQDARAMTALQAHADKVPAVLDFSELPKLAEDTSLPEDLRAAYAHLSGSASMQSQLDTADRRYAWKGPDGKFSKYDISEMSKDARFVEANRALAQAGTERFIPSDADRNAAVPRQMTASDAWREMYLYSDSLPDLVDPEALQAIVDGQCKGKCPAQLRAAAQYLLNNPAELEKVTLGDGAWRSEIEDHASKNVNLHPDELTAIETVLNNQDVFLKDGDMTRESLKRLAADESANHDVRKAAQKLLDDPLVFGMLDNADKGYDAHKGPVNDGVIWRSDLNAVAAGLTSVNRKAPAEPVPAAKVDPGPRVGETEELAQARVALAKKVDEGMASGWADDPDIKIVQPKIKSCIEKFAQGLLNVVGKVIDVVKTAVDAIGGLLPPPLSTAVLGIGAGLSAVNNFVIKPCAAVLDGIPAAEAFKQAGKAMAMDLAGTAVSLIPGGGLARAGMAVAKEAVGGAVGGAVTAAVSTVGKNVTQKGLDIVANPAAREALGNVKDLAIDLGTDELHSVVMAKIDSR